MGRGRAGVGAGVGQGEVGQGRAGQGRGGAGGGAGQARRHGPPNASRPLGATQDNCLPTHNGLTFLWLCIPHHEDGSPKMTVTGGHGALPGARLRRGRGTPSLSLLLPAAVPQQKKENNPSHGLGRRLPSTGQQFTDREQGEHDRGSTTTPTATTNPNPNPECPRLQLLPPPLREQG